MAFPIPAHLPRKKDLDVSTTVLSKMSETSLKALSHGLASTWVSELDIAIRQTKVRGATLGLYTTGQQKLRYAYMTASKPNFQLSRDNLRRRNQCKNVCRLCQRMWIGCRIICPIPRCANRSRTPPMELRPSEDRSRTDANRHADTSFNTF